MKEFFGFVIWIVFFIILIGIGSAIASPNGFHVIINGHDYSLQIK